MTGRIFRDRAQAGAELAAALADHAGRADALVLALPRGGVPVGFEVARALRLPLDLMLVRKLGLPCQQEFAMGALAEGGVLLLPRHASLHFGISEADVEQVVAREKVELLRRQAAYREGRPAPSLRGKLVILVDDGLATGFSMRAAVAAARQQEAQQVLVAVPIGAADSCRQLGAEADQVLCLEIPDPFHAVGYWYQDFGQTGDQEVLALLRQARQGQAGIQ